MNLNKNTIKHYCYVMMVMMVIVALVSVNPLSYIGYDNASPVGESKGFVATSTAIGVTAATVAGSFVAGYTYSEFFTETNPQAGTNATDEDGSINESYVRQETQLDAIRSEGNNELFNEQFDNDLITLEGQVEQRINQRYIKLQADNKTNNITSETEAVTESADASGKYLKTGMNNYVETHNYGVKALAGYQDDLEVANSSELMGATNIIVGNGSHINDKLGDYTENGNSNTDLIIKMTSDWEVNNSTPTSSKNGDKVMFFEDSYNNVTINGGGYNIDINVSARMYENIDGITFKNVDISAADNIFGRNIDKANFINTNLTAQYPSDGATNIFVSNDSNVPYSSTNDNKLDIDVTNDITFNTSEVANVSSTYNNSSEVPRVTIVEGDNNTSNVTLTAKNVSLNTSYYSDGGVNVAVPYKTSTGEPINNSETVLIQTPNTGIQGYAEPVNFDRAFNIINKRDDLSGQVYTFAEQYGKDVWNDYLQEIVNDDNRTIFTDGVDEELSSLQFSAPTTPKGTVSAYTGTFEGTTKPWTDKIKFKNTSNNETVTGALFTDDIKALTNQTSDNSVITDGDVMNMSKAGKVFVVNQDNAKKTELKGEWEVVDVLYQDNATVRDYEQNTNNISKNAERLEDQREAIEITVDGAGEGISLPSFGDNGGILLIVGLIGAIVILRD